VCFGLEKSFQLGAGAHLTLENEIAALQQRPRISETQISEELAEVGHADLPVTADIDAADECDVGCQEAISRRDQSYN